MYEQFFGLAEKPFELLPNPNFLYPSKVHKKALAYLEYGLRERSGFILLTGEVGAGKTTIIRDLLKKDLRKTVLSKVFNTRVDSTQLVSMINDDFGLEVEGRDKVTMLRELTEFLIDQFAAGNRAVLIIDEAQNLSEELLEEVRMLSNLETDNAKLLQIILVGQPELKATLNSPSLRQLRQRILVQCHLTPLTETEVEEYILYRLERAGNRNAVEWGDESFQEVYETTQGVPRLVNILCDYLLLDAFSSERNYVGAEHVVDVVEEMEFRQQFFPQQLFSDTPGGAGRQDSSVAQDVSQTQPVYGSAPNFSREPAAASFNSRQEERDEALSRISTESFADTLEGSFSVSAEESGARRARSNGNGSAYATSDSLRREAVETGTGVGEHEASNIPPQNAEYESLQGWGEGQRNASSRSKEVAHRMMRMLRDMQQRLDLLEAIAPKVTEGDLFELGERVQRLEQYYEESFRQVGRLSLIVPQLEARLNEEKLTMREDEPAKEEKNWLRRVFGD